MAEPLPTRIQTIRSRAREHQRDLNAMTVVPRKPGVLRCRYLYFIRNPALGIIKIGVTNDVEGRRAVLEYGCGVPLDILRVVENSWLLEHDLHGVLAAARLKGEWFEPTPELVELATNPRIDPWQFCADRRRGTWRPGISA